MDKAMRVTERLMQAYAENFEDTLAAVTLRILRAEYAVTDAELVDAMRVCEAATTSVQVGFDGPSRPIIRCGKQLLSISSFENGAWVSYETEEADCNLYVLARTLLPRLIAEVQESRNRKGEGDGK